MTLGEQLRRLRKVQRLTLTNVGTATGLSVSFLSDIELDKAKPSLDNLEKLATFYKVALDDLLKETNLGIQLSEHTYPPGYSEFIEEMRDKIDPVTEELVLRVEHRAKRRAQTKEDWLQLYYSLKAILGR